MKAPVARNLLQEVADDRKQKIQPLGNHKRSRSSKSADHDLYVHADDLQRTPGEAQDLYVNGVVIQISDEAYNLAKETSLACLHEALSVLPGVYHMVGVWEKNPVFKQEAYPGEVNNDELMLFYSAMPHFDGWHFVDKIFWNDATYQTSKVIALGVGEEFPTGVIVPLWAPEARAGVTCTPLAEYQQEQIEKLESKMADLESENAGLRDAVADLEGDNAVLRDAVDSKFKDKKGGHGGWLPKCAKMIAAFYNHHTKKLKGLCDEYYAFSPILKQLVDENVNS